MRTVSDVSIRTASRLLAAECTDTHTRAAVIAGLIRSGRLDRRRVALASYLGDEAALLVEPAAEPAVPAHARGWGPARRVLRWGGLPGVEIVCLAADCAERVIDLTGEYRGACVSSIEAARAWAVCPCADHGVGATNAAWVAARAAEGADAAEDAAWTAAWAAWAAAPVPRDEEQWQAEHIAAHLLDPMTGERRLTDQLVNTEVNPRRSMMPKQKKTTYKVREIMARWRQGYSEKEIADALRTTEVEIETVIAENRKPDENDPATKRLMGRFRI